MESLVFTIGHGNRSATELLGLLQAAQIAVLVDVRAHPASKRHPKFARGALTSALQEAGIAYVWAGKNLGGFRKPRPDSPHHALAAAGFRGYADHMQTTAFEHAMAQLMEMAKEQRPAIMCAENNPAECHRALISDWLVMQGVAVTHLNVPGAAQMHQVHAAAHKVNGQLIYDLATQANLF